MWDMVDGNGGRVLYNWDLVCSVFKASGDLIQLFVFLIVLFMRNLTPSAL
jgi:hypothetical protein